MPRPRRGVLDTSVVIDLDDLDPSQLPLEVAVSAVTMAELAAGPHATTDPDVKGRRQDRLQRAEAAFDTALRQRRRSRLQANIKPDLEAATPL